MCHVSIDCLPFAYSTQMFDAKGERAKIETRGINREMWLSPVALLYLKGQNGTVVRKGARGTGDSFSEQSSRERFEGGS